MKNLIICLLVAALLLMAAGCAQGTPGKFMLTVSRSGKPLLICRFEGEDKNGDGILEAAELTSFTETEDYAVSEQSRSTGFAAYTAMEKMPMLEHGPDDIRVFRFNLNEFKQGRTALEYKTDTKRDFTVGKYYFWRIMEIKADGKVSFFHGVGDGTQGLSLSMLDSSTLSYMLAGQ